MPTFNKFRGDAQSRRQVDYFRAENVEVGDKFYLVCNLKTIEVIATAATAANVHSQFVGAIMSTDSPPPEEFREGGGVFAETYTNPHDGIQYLKVSGPGDGTPLTWTTAVANASINVLVTTPVEGVNGQNEKQRIRLGGTPTGGTFTATFSGQTTANIAYNGSIYDVRDALCDLSNIAGTDEVQRLTSTATGGTFKITFEGQQTGDIAFNASAATIQTALEALSNIAVGEVVCAGGALNVAFVSITFKQLLGRSDRTQVTIDNTSATGGTVVPSTTTAGVASDVTVTLNATSDWTVEFGGAYAQTDVPIMSGSGALLTGGGGVSVATTQQGGPIAEYQRVTVNPSGSFTWALTFGGFTTTYFTGTGIAAFVQSQLESLPSIGAGNVIVGYEYQTATEDRLFVIFTGTLNGVNVAEMTLGGASTTGIINTFRDGSSQNEIQVVTITGGPTGGTFTLTFEGQTTGPIAYNASTATVVTALEALSNIGVGDVGITGSAGGPYTVTFQAALAGSDRQQMTGSGASLTGGSVSVSVIQEAIVNVNEQQVVELEDVPSSGTFTLTFNSQTTTTIAYNASAATVQAALEGLATPVPGDVSVSGVAGGPWTVTFTGAYAHTNVSQMTADGSLLAGVGSQTFTKTSVIVPTGPYHMDDANNWTLGHTPADAEIVVFENSDRPVKYGLIFTSVEPAEVIFESTYEADAGLDDYNPRGYYEYRNKEITFGTAPGANSIKVTIGRGEGNGSSMIRICTNDVQTEVDVYLTGPMKKNKPCVLWRGTHASNSVNVYRGSIGIASGAGEAATVDQLRISYIETVDSDAYVVVGPGVTLNTVTKDAGYLQDDCAVVTAFTQLAGDTDFNGTGAMAQLYNRGGVFNYNSSGTLNGATIVSGDGELVFDHDLRPKTVANPIDVYGDDAEVVDSYKVAGTNGFTAGDFVIDYNETTRNPTLGRNYRIIRRATA